MADKKFFSIGSISKIKGMTIKALRFYEKKGLVTPHHVDPSSKYRYYSLEQFFRLDIIKAARDMDMSLKDIKAILKQKNQDELLKILDTHKGKMAQKIAELQRIVREIDELQNNIENSVSSASNKDIYFKEIPQRYVITTEYNGTTDLEYVFSIYSKIAEMMNERNLISTFETGIIFEPDSNYEFHPTRIYNAIAVDEPPDSDILSVIPAGRYLCISYNRENAEEQQGKLFQYLENNKLSPELMLQADLLTDLFDTNSCCFELQLLILG